jgi:hypothetical protein
MITGITTIPTITGTVTKMDRDRGGELSWHDVVFS